MDDAAVLRIVEALGDLRARVVVEVGPGRGAITDLLAARAGTLIAVELDRTLGPALAEKYAGNPVVRLLQQDILSVDLTAVVRELAGDGRGLLVGNLPYYITSDILLHIADHADALELAVVMMQREVAERVTAMPGTREYGMLSATVQMMAQAEMLFTLPPSAFRPPPNVHSTVVRLRMKPRYEELGVERAGFERFLRIAFAQKRKTLANNLRSGGYESRQVGYAMAGMDADVRAEAVALEAMARVYRALVA